MATASSHRMPQAHEALGRASRGALPVPVGRRATQVWPSALPRNRVASAWPDNAEARQARMVATRFHERAIGAQGHRLSGEVRHEDSNIGGPVSEGLPAARSRCLDRERRVYRSWWMLPKYQRERCEPADRVRRARGGGWRSVVTGEWWESVAYCLGGWQLSALPS